MYKQQEAAKTVLDPRDPIKHGYDLDLSEGSITPIALQLASNADLRATPASRSNTSSAIVDDQAETTNDAVVDDLDTVRRYHVPEHFVDGDDRSVETQATQIWRPLSKPQENHGLSSSSPTADQIHEEPATPFMVEGFRRLSEDILKSLREATTFPLPLPSMHESTPPYPAPLRSSSRLLPKHTSLAAHPLFAPRMSDVYGYDQLCNGLTATQDVEFLLNRFKWAMKLNDDELGDHPISQMQAFDEQDPEDTYTLHIPSARAALLDLLYALHHRSLHVGQGAQGCLGDLHERQSLLERRVRDNENDNMREEVQTLRAKVASLEQKLDTVMNDGMYNVTSAMSSLTRVGERMQRPEHGDSAFTPRSRKPLSPFSTPQRNAFAAMKKYGVSDSAKRDSEAVLGRSYGDKENEEVDFFEPEDLLVGDPYDYSVGGHGRARAGIWDECAFDHDSDII